MEGNVASGEPEKSEAALFNWLRISNLLIPKNKRDFVRFVHCHLDAEKYSDSIVTSVWKKMKHFDKKIKNCPTIELHSSDDEKPIHLTQVIDFDAADDGNEVSFTCIDTSPKASGKIRKKAKKACNKKRSQVKPELSKASETSSLLKKFREKIILEEILKRDEEMLVIQQREDKFETAVQIEMKYAKRIQKDRVNAMAEEMLRLHQDGFRGGLPDDQVSKPNVCLVEPQPLCIPEDKVIAEKLPEPERSSEDFSLHLSDDCINYDMIYPDESAENDRTKTCKRLLGSSTTPERAKKRKKSLGKGSSLSSRRKSKSNREADKLRQKLFIDTLIEINLPEVVEEVRGSASSASA